MFFFRITIIFFNPFIKIINIRPSRCPKTRIFLRFHRGSVVSCVTPEGLQHTFLDTLTDSHPPFPPPLVPYEKKTWNNEQGKQQRQQTADPANTTRSVPVAPPSRQVWRFFKAMRRWFRLDCSWLVNQPPALTYLLLKAYYPLVFSLISPYQTLISAGSWEQSHSTNQRLLAWHPNQQISDD